MKYDITHLLSDKFKNFFQKKTGHNILNYNEKFLKRKIEGRLKKLKVSSFREYFEKLILDKEIDTELDTLFHTIINRESDFFRHPDQFNFFNQHVLPELISKAVKTDNKTIRILSIGIALGQEPYSITMMIKENKDLFFKDIKIQLDAIDITRENLSFAKKGIYNRDELRYFLRYKEKHFKDLFNKYFISLNGNNENFKINKNLTQMINFKKMNIVSDKNTEKYDIIFCRNVMIYFDNNEKEKAINNIYNMLIKDGYLFLGNGEYPVSMRKNFKTNFYKNNIIYKKL